ncbi:MAG: DNA gyrase/topoisomerase IV subunit A [Cytophagia bacterium]|nr:MAG: DNA gyrase/topoisomerase IV subunit A [Cytophagia bacterium]TAH29228.1 MAG: DNA gyrase/topoisomerase IV subunit A [Cytophagales bacterium]
MTEQQHTISDLYQDWFLDYASYVILERAVPNINDGLKPVQRRILHAMFQMDDGRFHKVANVVGQAMQYHPHGDASIYEALVSVGQKDLMVDTQGNWGDMNTGDGAAAARYIESRLSKFALEVGFNPQTTHWQKSYDGRKKEPITLPMKFPFLLAQGTEGIAVGLATKVMPHNFCELIEASIDILNGKETNIMPDFFMGGIADCSQYRGGMKGGKIRIRSHIEIRGKKDLVIKDIPYGCTTGSLIDSILKANDEGKIKIKKVIDNTAKDVEILVELAAGISPEQTIDALYAFTDCEVSISPNTCVIVGNKPQFIDVNEMLKICTFNTKDLLKEELEIKKNDLLEKILYGSLEKIFIENRIYRDIEECTTWEDVLLKIDIGLTPYKPQFYREIIKDDLIRLTEIKIKRISKYDTFKADELMKSRAQELKETEEHLANLNRFSINYFKNLLKKYGKGRERRTELQSFDAIKGTEVALNNQKLYVNRADGFIGYGLKKDEFVCDCSDIDDIIIFTDDGKYYIKKIGEKVFVAKNIIYLAVFNKDLKDATFNTIYKDGESGISMMKRFQVQGVIRDKEYDLTKGNPKSKLMYFSANLQGETEIVKVTLSPSCSAKNKTFEYNFADLEVKGKTALGNILTKYPVKKIDFKSKSDAAKKKTTDEKAGENALFKGK